MTDQEMIALAEADHARRQKAEAGSTASNCSETFKPDLALMCIRIWRWEIGRLRNKAPLNVAVALIRASDELADAESLIQHL